MGNELPEIPPELIAAARSGDEPAWRRLVELLYPTVAGIIRNHLRRVADREDVAQEVFVKIFLKLGQYSGTRPLDHWVARITLNTCHDWLRKLKARPQTSYSDLGDRQREILERTLAANQHDPDSDPNLLHDLLDRLLATLKPREQIVIRLLDLEQRSVQDACHLTGWGASMIKVTAMRARRKLADRLRRLEPPGQH
jgi:RNA polymerase sigma-70 factor (ECF subfamily)